MKSKTRQEGKELKLGATPTGKNKQTKKKITWRVADALVSTSSPLHAHSCFFAPLDHCVS